MRFNLFESIMENPNISDILEEGLFSIYGFCVSSKKITGKYIDDRTSVFPTKEKALRPTVKYECKGKLTNPKQYQTHANENDLALIIPKKYEKNLDKDFYLYKCKLNKGFSGNDKKYGVLSDDKTIIVGSEKDTLRNFIKKYHISIEVEDTKDGSDDRAKVLKLAIGVFEKELRSIKSKYPIKNSIYIRSKSDIEEDKEDFIDGVSNYISIGSYDLWKFTSKARDEEENEKFWKYSNEFQSNVNKELSKYNASIKAEGDWDDGFYDLHMKK